MTILMIILLMLVVITATVVTVLALTSRARSAGNSDAPSDDEGTPPTREERRAMKVERIEHKRLPYSHLEPDGLFFVHGKAVWTAITLPSITDENMGAESLQSTALRQNHLLTMIAKQRNARTDFHLRVVGRETTPDEWATNVIAHAPRPSQWYRKAIWRMADRLSGQGERTTVRVLLVRLGTVSKQKDPSARLASTAVGVVETPLTATERERWRQEARDTQMVAATAMSGAKPTDRQTLIWLIRKPLHGGLPVDPAPNYGTRPWGPGEFSLIAGMQGTNHREYIRVVQHDDDGHESSSCTAVVVVDDQPDSSVLRKSTALVRHALAFQPGADLSWRFSMIPPQQFLDTLKDIRTNLEDEKKNMERVRIPVDSQLKRQVVQAAAAEEDAKDNDLHGVLGSAQFVLSAPTRRALDEKITEFVTHMANINIGVVRPRRLQYRLIESSMPGDAPRLAVAPWSRLTDPDVFALSMPSSGTDLGDSVSIDRDGRTELGWIGRYVGYLARDGASFFNDLHCGLARNKGGGVAVVGASGGGKSLHGMYTFLFETEAGRRGLAMDPKEDFAFMCYYLAFGEQVTQPGFMEEAAEGTLGKPGSRFQPVWPEFWDETDIIDLQRSQDGTIDPFIVAPSVAEGILLARTFFDTVLTADQKRACERHIDTALEDMAERYERDVFDRAEVEGEEQARLAVPRPSMTALIAQLEMNLTKAIEASATEAKIDDIAYTIKTLRGLARQPFSRLAFGDATTAGVSALKKRRTVITMRGFPIPTSPEPREWRPDMRAGAAAMMLVLELANSMLTNDGTQKLVAVDEAHILLMFPDGRGMLRRGVRVGRSTDTVFLIISQQSPDLKRMEEEAQDGEGANQFHEIFIFKQKTDSEARPSVELLGLDSSDASVLQCVQEPNLQTGMCVVRDADNRTGTVVIDQLWHELRSATETNPQRRNASQSRHFNPDVSKWTWSDEPDAREVTQIHQLEASVS